MYALFDLMSRSLLGLVCCAGLALGLSYVGNKAVARGEDPVCNLAIGQCRQCGNAIRFKPREWCASCRVCKQLTNVDQALKLRDAAADVGDIEVASLNYSR